MFQKCIKAFSCRLFRNFILIGKMHLCNRYKFDWGLQVNCSFKKACSSSSVKEDLISIIRQLCLYKEVKIIEGHMMPDHVHMLVLIPPKLAISDFMGYLRSKSTLMIFDKHANLNNK